MMLEDGWKVVDPVMRGGKNVRLVESFLASDEVCIAKDMGDDGKALSKRNMLMQIIKNNERYAGIKATKRGTLVILVKQAAA